jgi:hypothetical protein
VQGYGIFHIPVEMSAGLWDISYVHGYGCRVMGYFMFVDMGAGFWEISYTFGHKCRAEGNVIKLWT